LPKIMWLKENQREIYNQSDKFIGVQDLVVYFLTGNYKTDYTQGCRTMLMNIETFQWDKDLLAIAGIGEEKLPKLLPPGSIAGYLLENVAKETNLPSGIPVIMS